MSSSTTATNHGAKPNAQYDVPPSVFTLRRTAQLEALYTIIRDKNTSRGDFIFYSDRIIRLLVEEGLNHLPVVPKNVETPTVRAAERTLTFQLPILNACREPVTKALVLRERSAACLFCVRGRCVCWPLYLMSCLLNSSTCIVQAMEQGLREVCRSVRIGKILIQRVNKACYAPHHHVELTSLLGRGDNAAETLLLQGMSCSSELLVVLE